MHYIFDEAARLATKMFTSAGTFGWVAGVEGFKGSSDNSAELANGWIIKADTIAELARRSGGTRLRAGDDRQVERVLRGGKDEQFDLTGDDTGPVHAAGSPPRRLQRRARSTRSPVYQGTLNTQGGITRNPKSQVMSIEGPPIPRLYAAGENGDIWTILYQCMSNAGAGCLVHGRIAGQEAAKLTRWDATTTATLTARRTAAR